MPITVRPAEPGDIEWMLEELAQFAHFYGTEHSLFGQDYAHNVAFLEVLIKGHCVLVAEDGAEKVGLIAGALAPHHFNPSLRVLTEYFWWTKEASQARAGLELLKAFNEFGDRHADWVVLTLVEGRSPIKDTHLTRRGFHLHEKSYLREVS